MSEMNMVETFIASVAHEIKTPMNGVLGYLQLLQRTSLNTTQTQYVNSMQQCAVQLMQIISDILDFSKLSAGKMTISSECFSLTDIEGEITNILGQRILEKKQTIKYCVQNPGYIILDKCKLIQILVNLVGNANKYTNIGGNITVDITTDTITEDNILKIAVRDTGIGISPENLDKLFNIYVQLDQSRCKMGSGLGLAIVKKITDLLGGNIRVESEVGVGSVFYIDIPFRSVVDYESEIQKDVAYLSGKKVLVVDDNVDNRILLSELLFEWKMQPVVCSSPIEAIRLILGNRYDFSLGLIDICMDGMSGIELAEKIKKERPLFPLIALSSLEGGLRNMTNFESKLDKPINKIQLFNEIYKIVINARQEKAYIGEDDTDSMTVSSGSSSPSCAFDKTYRILIADDIDHNRNMLRDMLSELGYKNIDQANNGIITLEKIEKSYSDNDPYHILLLDLLMPEMGGHEVISRLHSKKYKLPKIIVVTASVMEEDKRKCKEGGVLYFLTKPFDMGQLRDIMLHCCERSRSALETME